MINIGPNTKLRRNPSLVFSEINGEGIMLNVDKGAYFAMNAVGTTIWNELAKPLDLNELILKLQEIYDVSENHCIEDVEVFLQQLFEAKIIEISNEKV